MKLSDFHIGLEFFGGAGFRWRCTDTGSRTVLAIRVTGRAPEWLAGPPYIVDEVVFDEHEIARCYLTQEDAILTAKHAHESSGHPGYSSEAVGIMIETEFGKETGNYPNPGVLRFDRRRTDGEILHPCAASRDGQDWRVLVHLPFLNVFEDVPEADTRDDKIKGCACAWRPAVCQGRLSSDRTVLCAFEHVCVCDQAKEHKR